MAEPREAASSQNSPAGPVRISEMLCDTESRLASLAIDPSLFVSLRMHELGSPACHGWAARLESLPAAWLHPLPPPDDDSLGNNARKKHAEAANASSKPQSLDL